MPQDVAELRTLREMVDRSVGQYGGELALSLLGGEQFSYSDVAQCIHGAHRELIARGIEPGDKVALLGENRPEWGIAYLSVTSMGAVVVPSLPDFSAAEIASIIEHSEAKALIASESLSKKTPELPTLQFTLSLDELTTFRRSEGSEEVSVPEPREEELAAILYTSGTTGRPKGVMLTHRNVVQNVIGSRKKKGRRGGISTTAHKRRCQMVGVTTLRLQEIGRSGGLGRVRNARESSGPLPRRMPGGSPPSCTPSGLRPPGRDRRSSDR